jgi:PilZ domain
MTPAESNTRRWQRQQVDLPVSVVVLNGVSRIVIPGRATEISEGGMALYAGMIHPKRGDLVEVEFQIPSHARVAAMIRNRACFSFGLEFLTPVVTDSRTVSQLAAFALMQGLQAEAEPSAAAAENAASAYTMLAQVLRLEGQPLDAQVVDQAVVLFLRMRDVCLRQQALSIKTLRRRLATLYRAGLLLAGYAGLLKADAGR